MLSFSNASAQNKVVVIPLAGNDAAPGIAEFVGGNQVVTLDSIDAIIRSVTINAPTDGVVIVNASGYFQAASEKPSCRCSITIGTTIDTDSLTVSGDISDTQRGPFAGTRGFNVSAGSHTYNLVCDLFSGSANIRNTHLTAMYFPD